MNNEIYMEEDWDKVQTLSNKKRNLDFKTMNVFIGRKPIPR